MREKRTEHDGHDGIDVGVGRHFGRFAMTQKPGVRDVADNSADQHEINKGEERLRGDLVRIEAAQLTARHSGREQERASAEHLLTGREKGRC